MQVVLAITWVWAQSRASPIADSSPVLLDPHSAPMKSGELGSTITGPQASATFSPPSRAV